MDKNITIKNISSATVVLSVPELKFRRELIPGRTINIERELYDELVFEPGIQNLVTGGYIKFDGIGEAEAALDEPDTYDVTEIKAMLSTRDITKFAKFIPTAPDAAKTTIVDTAVDLGITDSAFTALIKKYCGVDVVDAIHKKHQLEE